MFSIIIPTGNSFSKKGGCIQHVLLSLSRQMYKNIEIIVVSNGNEGEIINNFIKENLEYTKTNIIYAPGANRPESRNIGAQHARYDYLIFMDDDTILPKDSILSEMNKVLISNRDIVFGLGAKRFWTKELGWFQNNSDYILNELKNERYSILTNNSFLPKGDERENGGETLLGRSFIASFGYVKKSVFKGIGGFPEAFDFFDDDILLYNLYKKKYLGISFSSRDVIHVNHERKSESLIEEECFKKFLTYLGKDRDRFCSLQLIQSLEDTNHILG